MSLLRLSCNLRRLLQAVLSAPLLFICAVTLSFLGKCPPAFAEEPSAPHRHKYSPTRVLTSCREPVAHAVDDDRRDMYRDAAPTGPTEQLTVGPSDSTKSIDADRDIRSRKPLGFTMTLAATTSVIIAVSAGHMLTAAVELGGSVFALSAILAYESYGAAAQIRYYLLPRRHFAPFVAVAAGPLWKKIEGGDVSLAGGTAAIQFGWAYSFEAGLDLHLAFGPVLAFVKDEKVNGAILQIGVGWRF